MEGVICDMSSIKQSARKHYQLKLDQTRINKYLNGQSLRQVAEGEGVSRWCIALALEKHGVPRRPGDFSRKKPMYPCAWCRKSVRKRTKAQLVFCSRRCRNLFSHHKAEPTISKLYYLRRKAGWTWRRIAEFYGVTRDRRQLFS